MTAPAVAPRRLAVLGAGDESADLVRILERVALTEPVVVEDRSDLATSWPRALLLLEQADVVVVAVTAAAVADASWVRLVEYAVDLAPALVVVIGDETPLASWPAELRDVMPAMVDRVDRHWEAELVDLVERAEASRPNDWSPPPRPEPPDAALAPGPVPSPAPGPGQTAPDPMGPGPDPFDEDVQFTVYRPGAARPGQWHWLLVFIHKSQPGAEMLDPLAEVRRQAISLLGDEMGAYGALTADSTGPLRRGTTLLVEPWLDSATFNPSTIELRWEEPVHRADFRFRLGEAGPATARGGVRIFVGAVLVGELTMTVRVGADEAPASVRVTARRFRKVFASYSHADTEVVEAVASTVRLLGDEYLIDAHALHSGDDWERELGRLIDDADVFQLFWSHNALRSPYVLRECQHAMSLGRDGFIRPVFWEEPLPEDPVQDLPPPDIRRLHFSRLADPRHDRDPSTIPVQAPVSSEAVAAPSTPSTPIHPPAAPPRDQGQAPPQAPARPRTVGTPGRWTRTGRVLPLLAGAMVVALGIGVGRAALQDQDTNDASPGAAPSTPVGTTDEFTEPTDPVVAATTAVGTVPSTGGESGLLLRRRFPVMADADCQVVEPIAELEAYVEECALAAPGSGAPISFRGAVTAGGLTADRYLDELSRLSGVEVVGRGDWTSDGQERGPYLDLTTPGLGDTRPPCRAWGDRAGNLVAWACADEAGTVLEFWEANA